MHSFSDTCIASGEDSVKGFITPDSLKRFVQAFQLILVNRPFPFPGTSFMWNAGSFAVVCVGGFVRLS